MRALRFAYPWVVMAGCGLAAAGCSGGDSSGSGGGQNCNPFTGTCGGGGGSGGGNGGSGPATEINCINGIDDDGDGLVDCLDPDCFSNVACRGVGGGGGTGGLGVGGTGGLGVGGTGGLGVGGTGGTCTYSTTPALNCTPTAAFVGVGSVVSGSLTTTDATGSPRGTGYYADAIAFQGTAGAVATITVTASSTSTGGTLDTYMYLMDDTCTQLAANDDSAGNFRSMIVWTLPYTGTYTVFVTTFSSCVVGTYTVTLT